MSLRIENVRFSGQNLYSVIYNPDGRDRLVIQTSNYSLAQDIVKNNYSDGFQIPKDAMEKSHARESILKPINS